MTLKELFDKYDSNRDEMDMKVLVLDKDEEFIRRYDCDEVSVLGATGRQIKNAEIVSFKVIPKEEPEVGSELEVIIDKYKEDLTNDEKNAQYKKMLDRKKMVLAMEYIARQINDESIFMDIWLSEGVADGDIPYGSRDVEDADSYYTEDENFSDLMKTFLRCMVKANESGGLYCGDVVSKGARIDE